MTVLVATDLDRTLIYSVGAMALDDGQQPDLVCVEVYDHNQASFMTAAAAQDLIRLHSVATVVAVTTRTAHQLARVRLPGPPPEFAVAANGGVLLINGDVDAAWSRQVRIQLDTSAPLASVWQHLSRVCRPDWTIKLANADNFFCYAVIDRGRMPADFLSEVNDWAARRGWATSLQGRKLYWVPTQLTKSAAVAEIADRTGSDLVLAAGDSILDIDLLQFADRAIMPRHGELFDAGWNAPGVARTESAGVLAGAEIVRWFHSSV